MKKLLTAFYFSALFCCLPILSFAAEEEEDSGNTGTLIFGILATVLFCVGMVIIYKWDKKIKHRDTVFEEELEKFVRENGENGEDEESADGDRTPENGEAKAPSELADENESENK